MKTTIQVIHAKKVLTELGIPLRKGKMCFRGVRVRAQRFRRVWTNEQGRKEIFYEFGSAIGKMYDSGTLSMILEKEASLLLKGVSIKYYRIDGEIVTAELNFGYKDGNVEFIGT